MTDPSVPTTVGTTSSPATDPVTSDSEEPADTTSPGSAPVTAPPAAGLTPTQQALADVAIADVVDRRGVTTAEVAVISVEEVTWSDRSLGCPQRDMQYQQVLTPGIRVILDAAGQRAFYHGTSIDDLAYCATPTSPIDG